MIYGLMLTSPLHVPAEHTHSPVCVCVWLCVWPFAKYFILTCHVDNCRHRQVASQQLRICLSHCISKLFISALPRRDELCCISKRARWKLAATWAWLKSGTNIWRRHKERSSTSRLVCLKRHTDTWIPRSGSDGKSSIQHLNEARHPLIKQPFHRSDWCLVLIPLPAVTLNATLLEAFSPSFSFIRPLDCQLAYNLTCQVWTLMKILKESLNFQEQIYWQGITGS